MSARKHKRRRIETDAERLFDDIDVLLQPPASESVDKELRPAEEEEAFQPEVEGDAEASAKEREVWDAFREEHYELLEQLPLSLHRAFTLIQELDQQAQSNIIHIAPAVLKYVSLRKALAAAAHAKSDPPQDPPVSDPIEHMNGTVNVPLTNGRSVNGNASSSDAPGPASSSKRQTPVSSPSSLASVVETSTSTRELLVHIAQSSEGVTRGCAEKVYLAQHAYDLVDRYIRDLDRAIKEQEASISLGLRPGTHPASIILPEVVPPPSTRGRVVATPPPAPVEPPIIISSPAPIPAGIPEETMEVVVEPIEEVIDVEATADEELHPEPSAAASEPPAPEPPTSELYVPDEAPAPTKDRKKGKKRKKGSTRRRTGQGSSEPANEGASEPAQDVVLSQVPPMQPTLTLRIPAQILPHATVEAEDMPPDPNEPRYCFCNQVSFGDMIACDSRDCTREWFHIGCVGLTRIPKGNWYCRECATLRKRPKSRKKAR
ncbi:hypothetical protein BC628DRAFT_655997 [Trametes gibbosa]|nr:hypothetical protein BC628DRAFT_655997 [Trametes gibbosa]